MGFIAAEAVPELSYDFNPHVKAAGVTPEPSTKQITQFQHTVKKIIGPTALKMAEAKAGGPVGEAQEVLDIDALRKFVEAGEESDDDDGTAQIDDLIGAIAILCSNKPSKNQIKALPYRILQNFIGYTLGVFLSPEQ